MILLIEKEFEKAEALRKKWLDKYADYSHEQLNFHPNGNEWSILQNFDHLRFAENSGLKYMQKKILGIKEAPNTGIKNAAKALLLNSAINSPLKFSAPSVATPPDQEELVYEDIVTAWDEVREEWVKVLNLIDVPNSKKEIFKHPAVGKLNIFQALSFLQAHMKRHMKQTERVEKHPDFPKA